MAIVATKITALPPPIECELPFVKGEAYESLWKFVKKDIQSRFSKRPFEYLTQSRMTSLPVVMGAVGSGKSRTANEIARKLRIHLPRVKVTHGTVSLADPLIRTALANEKITDREALRQTMDHISVDTGPVRQKGRDFDHLLGRATLLTIDDAGARDASLIKRLLHAIIQENIEEGNHAKRDSTLPAQIFPLLILPTLDALPAVSNVVPFPVKLPMIWDARAVQWSLMHCRGESGRRIKPKLRNAAVRLQHLTGGWPVAVNLLAGSVAACDDLSPSDEPLDVISIATLFEPRLRDFCTTVIPRTRLSKPAWTKLALLSLSSTPVPLNEPLGHSATLASMEKEGLVELCLAQNPNAHARALQPPAKKHTLTSPQARGEQPALELALSPEALDQKRSTLLQWAQPLCTIVVPLPFLLLVSPSSRRLLPRWLTHPLLNVSQLFPQIQLASFLWRYQALSQFASPNPTRPSAFPDGSVSLAALIPSAPHARLPLAQQVVLPPFPQIDVRFSGRTRLRKVLLHQFNARSCAGIDSPSLSWLYLRPFGVFLFGNVVKSVSADALDNPEEIIVRKLRAMRHAQVPALPAPVPIRHKEIHLPRLARTPSALPIKSLRADSVVVVKSVDRISPMMAFFYGARTRGAAPIAVPVRGLCTVATMPIRGLCTVAAAATTIPFLLL